MLRGGLIITIISYVILISCQKKEDALHSTVLELLWAFHQLSFRYDKVKKVRRLSSSPGLPEAPVHF